MSQFATKKFEKAEPTCNHCKKPGQYKNQWSAEKPKRTICGHTEIVPETTTVHPQTLFLTETTTITMPFLKMTRILEPSTLPVKHEAKWTTPHWDVILGQCSKQATSHEDQSWRTEWNSTTGCTEHDNSLCLGCDQIFRQEMSRLHSWTVSDRLEITRMIFPTVPAVDWQQPLETSVESSS